MAVFLFSSGMSQNGLGLKTWAHLLFLGLNVISQAKGRISRFPGAGKVF